MVTIAELQGGEELSAAAQADLWNHDPEFVAEFQQQREKGLEAQLMSSSEPTATAAMGARRFISCSRFRTRYEQGCTDHRSPKSAHWIAAGSRRSTPRASRSMRVWPNGASPVCAWSSVSGVLICHGTGRSVESSPNWRDHSPSLMDAKQGPTTC